MNIKETVSDFNTYIEVVLRICCISVNHEDTDWSQTLRTSKTDYLSERLDIKLFAQQLNWSTFCEKFTRVMGTEQVVLCYQNTVFMDNEKSRLTSYCMVSSYFVRVLQLQLRV